jgi:type II secretory pathway pseudopilin PulG
LIHQYNSIAPRTKLGISQRNAGFSLFELVVFIISVAIIYAAAARRFADFPGEAERANFFAITAQIQAGINLEMMMAITRGKAGSLNQYEGANPMDLLLDPPSNYVGAYDGADSRSFDRRVWYFDKRNNELVYLANDAGGLSHLLNGQKIPADRVSFKISVQYSYRDANTGLLVDAVDVDSDDEQGRLRRSIDGLLLLPTIPYEWESGGLEQNQQALLET